MADAGSESHATRGPLLLGLQWASFILATVVFIPRVIFRGFYRKNLGWDDACIAAAWILAVWNSAAITEAVKYGYGDHIEYVENVRDVLYWSTPAEIINVPAVCLVKVSICIFVMRILDRTHRTIRLIIWADLIMVVPVSIACMFVLIFQCIPLSAAWDELFPPDKCMNRKIVDDICILISSVNVFTDLLTTTIPIFIIARLQMKKSYKFGLCGLIGLGLGVTGISIAKAVTGAQDFSDTDSTWALMPVAICSALEHQLGIFVACLPVLTPLFSATYSRMLLVVSHVHSPTTSTANTSEKKGGVEGTRLIRN